MQRRVGENSGLCATCDNAATCMYVGDAEHPVMQCEEFSQRGAVPGTRDLAQLPETLDKEAARFLAEGLCGRCADRETCTIPRPSGGVWQCDAFRQRL